jgi:hypothetical protein
MDRPKQTTWAIGWIEYADWLEAELETVNQEYQNMDADYEKQVLKLEAERDNLLEGIATVTPYLRNKDENGYTVVNTFKLEALAALESGDD